MAKAPDAFRTISEVADWLDTPAHVLRFWESKFSQIKPVKRAGGRRYYRREDMALLGGIKKLLHEDGMTIKAAQQLLRKEGVKHVAGLCQIPLDSAEQEPEPEVVRLVTSDTAPQSDAPEPVKEQVAEADGDDGTGAAQSGLSGPVEIDTDTPVEAASPAGLNEPVEAPTFAAEDENQDAAEEAEDNPDPELPFGDRQDLPSFLKPVAEETEAPQEEPVEPTPELPSFLKKEETPREPLGVDIPADPADADVTSGPGAVSLIAGAARGTLFDKASEIAPLARKLTAYGSSARAR